MQEMQTLHRDYAEAYREALEGNCYIVDLPERGNKDVNLFHNPIVHEQPEHGRLKERLTRALVNFGVEIEVLDFHARCMQKTLENKAIKRNNYQVRIHVVIPHGGIKILICCFMCMEYL